MFSYQLLKLADQVGEQLNLSQKKLAVAESCTGGLLAAVLTEIPGSSAWFERGIVTYSNTAKEELLGVKSFTLKQFGAVSAETALEMVTGILANSAAAWGIAITGIAGPTGGTTDKPVGTVFIGWGSNSEPAEIKKYFFTGNRSDIRLQTVHTALDELISKIRSVPSNQSQN